MQSQHMINYLGIQLNSTIQRNALQHALPPVFCFLFVLLFIAGCNEPHSSHSLPDKVSFNFDVRPILVQNCYLCHGPDPSSRKADLRLDTYEGATTLREKGVQAIVPGKAKYSEMIRRITAEEPDVVMPPPESNLKLTDYQVAVLKKWIDQGAEWTPHWAFIQPKHTPPDRGHGHPSTNEIDDYINAQMSSPGIEPAPRASKQKLLRRVSFLLTGLPPTTEMIHRFTNEESEDAYAQMIDHYLNSPAFGERWARHWMDVVRYAETRGHEFDYAIQGAWQYRDYLIRAFNDDIPYDQLLREQLAGDLLGDPRWNEESVTNESHVATMFYTFSEGKHSPVDTKKEEADRIDNMIDVTSKSFQGLTVSCARCHDHKFDPIPTADYYAMYGVLQSSRFSPVPVVQSAEKLRTLEEINAIKASIRRNIADNWYKDPMEPDQQQESSDHDPVSQQADSLNYEILGDFRNQDLANWHSDGFAFGNRSTLGDPIFNRDQELVGFSEGLASSRSISTGIFGALRSPGFEIDKKYIGVMARGKQSSIRIILNNFQLIQNPIYGELEMKVNEENLKAYVVDVSPWEGQTAYIELMPGTYKKHEYDLPEDAYIEASYALAFDGDWPNLVPVHGQKIASEGDLLDAWVSGDCNAQQVRQLNKLLKTGEAPAPGAEVLAKLEQMRERTAMLKDTAFFNGIYEGEGRDSPVFIRGNTGELSENEVPRGYLTILSNRSDQGMAQGSGRLEMVENMLDPNNPLTARVMVNRIWHYLFGQGIVETVDNFGLQGKLPSHPELLDHLAIRFVEDGWSIKSMIRYMLMTETFQRDVDGAIGVDQADPKNVLLAQFPLRRLEAEAIHDALLFASGSLNTQMYGPPVPVHLTEFMKGRGRPRESGPLDGNGRRNIYREVRRNFLEPMMLTFDRPIPFSTNGKRNVTNVPAQSLVLMNDAFVLQQAGRMAEQVVDLPAKEPEKRIQYIYERTLSRLPTEEEIASALEYLDLLRQVHGVEQQQEIASVEVWKDYCHSVFNLKEFIYLI